MPDHMPLTDEQLAIHIVTPPLYGAIHDAVVVDVAIDLRDRRAECLRLRERERLAEQHALQIGIENEEWKERNTRLKKQLAAADKVVVHARSDHAEHTELDGCYMCDLIVAHDATRPKPDIGDKDERATADGERCPECSTPLSWFCMDCEEGICRECVPSLICPHCGNDTKPEASDA